MGSQGLVGHGRPHKTGLRVTQPRHDLFGAQGRQVRQRITWAAQRGIVHHGHGRHGLAPAFENFSSALGAHRLERQRIRLALPVAKCVCRDRKPAVDPIDQRLGRTEVGAQHMVATCGGAARRQVTVDVGSAKTIDRLLGVTDQQERHVWPVLGDAVNAVKNPPLQGRGVLKLVDHRHRKLRAQALGQALARLGVGQRHIQALQQVGKAKQTAAPLELSQALQHLGAGVQAGCVSGVGQGLQGRLQLGIRLALRRPFHRRLAGFSASLQAVGGEAFPTAFHGFGQGRWLIVVLRPDLECAQPSGAVLDVQLATIPMGRVLRQLLLNPAQQIIGLFGPTLLERFELHFAFGQSRAQHLGQRAGNGIGQRHGHQGAHVLVKRRHIAPDPQRLRHQRCVHGVELLTPIVLHGF